MKRKALKQVAEQRHPVVESKLLSPSADIEPQGKRPGIARRMVRPALSLRLMSESFLKRVTSAGRLWRRNR